MADFVTGASGCLGRHLVRCLLEKGRRIFCAVRDPERLKEDSLFRSPQVTLIPCDFMSDDWMPRLKGPLASCGKVYHLAAEMPHRPTCLARKNVLWNVNVEAAKKLYGLSERADCFVFVSSIAVYGDSFEHPRDEGAPAAPGDFYAFSKWKAEEALLKNKPAAGPRLFVVRPGLIYGEHDTNVIQKFIELADRGYFRILGDGQNIRSISSARLVAETLCGLADSRLPGGIFNVIDPRLPTVRQLTDDIARLLGVPPPRSLPLCLAYPAAAVFSMLQGAGLQTRFKISDVRRMSTSNVVLNAKLIEMIGTIPDFYEETLRADVQWYRECQSRKKGPR